MLRSTCSLTRFYFLNNCHGTKKKKKQVDTKGRSYDPKYRGQITLSSNLPSTLNTSSCCNRVLSNQVFYKRVTLIKTLANRKVTLFKTSMKNCSFSNLSLNFSRHDFLLWLFCASRSSLRTCQS